MIEVLFEDDHIMVVDKPAGVLSQKAKADDLDLAALLKKQGATSKFLHPAHRLDRNVSGCLVLSKSKETAAKLTELLKTKDVKRTYIAVVKGDPGEEREIHAPIFKGENNTSRVDSRGKEATTFVRRLQKMPSTSLVELTLTTGRSHQIRVHLAHIGHAILGDKKYGKAPWHNLLDRPALHAANIAFVHPVTKTPLALESKLPLEIHQLLVQLKPK